MHLWDNQHIWQVGEVPRELCQISLPVAKDMIEQSSKFLAIFSHFQPFLATLATKNIKLII